MTFDLLSTVGLTASAAVAVATYVALFGSALTQRVAIGADMALWFIGVLWIGAAGNISTPLLGAAVLIPVAVFSVIGFRLVRQSKLASISTITCVNRTARHPTSWRSVCSTLCRQTVTGAIRACRRLGRYYHWFNSAPDRALGGSVATLQECSDKLGRYGPRTLSRRSVQMAPI